jgi:hypothetical protein
MTKAVEEERRMAMGMAAEPRMGMRPARVVSSSSSDQPSGVTWTTRRTFWELGSMA